MTHYIILIYLYVSNKPVTLKWLAEGVLFLSKTGVEMQSTLLPRDGAEELGDFNNVLELWCND